MPTPRGSSTSRRRRAQPLRRVQDAEEKRLEKKLQAELSRATQRASEMYPQWKKGLKGHQAAVGSILATSTARSALNAIDIARQNFSAPIAESLGRFLPTQEELQARVVSVAKQRAAQRAGEIASTTETRIGNAVARGLEANDSPAQIARNIRDDVEGMNLARARSIARTETAVATTTAQHEEMLSTQEALGMPLAKTWVATEDERTRETHSEADGQTVRLEDTFTVGEAQLQHPSDPEGPAEEVINCRCTIVYDPL